MNTYTTPQPPPVEPPRPGEPTVDLLREPPKQVAPKPERRVPLWVLVVAILAGGAAALIGPAIAYTAADDSDTVTELEDDLDRAQDNAADARDDEARAENRADAAERDADAAYGFGWDDGYREGYDEGYYDGIPPTFPYDPAPTLGGDV
jgi:hypothetical protein